MAWPVESQLSSIAEKLREIDPYWDRANWYRTEDVRYTSTRTTQEETNKVDLTRIEYGTGATIDQLIMAEAYMQVVADRIKANGHEVPDTLANALEKTTLDLKIKLAADRRRKLAALRLKREQLLSADEKRGKVEREIAELEALLATK